MSDRRGPKGQFHRGQWLYPGWDLKSLVLALAGLWAWAAPAAAGERYKIREEGGFGSTGRVVEFDDKYAWKSYEVEFDFSLSEEEKELAEGSSLRLIVHKKDGGEWKYVCRAESGSTPAEKGLWANVNALYGKGISVMT